VVADELFGRPIPVLELDHANFARASAASRARIDRGGRITFDDDTGPKGA
jgi:hypothetical protein